MQTDLPESRRGWRHGRGSGIIFPLLLVVVGLILLLNNLGVLPWSIWLALGQLWPVILIVFGVDLILGRRNPDLAVGITAAAIVFVAIVAVIMSLSGFPAAAAAGGVEERTASVPLQGASSGDVTVQYPAGNLTVGALPPDTTNLAQVNAALPAGLRLEPTSHLSGAALAATLAVNGNSRSWPFWGPNRGQGASFNALLTPRVPLTIRVNLGAGQSTLDLTALQVKQLSVQSGAGQTTIHFPASAGVTTADVENGAGQVNLVIPPGVGAYVHAPGGLVNVQVPSDRFQRVADGYQTADFATAPNRVDVTLRVGVGGVDVQ
jgi:hypothetical protein